MTEPDFDADELERLANDLADGLPSDHREYEILPGVVVWTDAHSPTLDILFTADATVTPDDAVDVLYESGDVEEEIAITVSNLLADAGVTSRSPYFERCDVANSPGTQNYQALV